MKKKNSCYFVSCLLKITSDNEIETQYLIFTLFVDYQTNIFHLFKVFLVLWWWLFFLVFVGFSRFGFRIIQIYSARLRFYMLKMRMQRYFKRSASTDKIKNYICKCSRGDWFVLYQLSKNLNRVFFMDFLVTLSKTVDPKSPARDEQGDEEDGILKCI